MVYWILHLSAFVVESLYFINHFNIYKSFLFTIIDKVFIFIDKIQVHSCGRGL